MVLVITVFSQAIIIEFGGIVFHLDPDGLSWSNWGFSILLGAGSLLVGFILRIMPQPPIPDWMIGQYEADSVPQPIIIVESGDIGRSELSTASESSSRWDNAIRKTRMQVRVVKVFTLPSSDSVQVPSPRPSSHTPAKHAQES